MDHFPKDCPARPSEVSNQGPQTSLNYIGIVPSPNNSESEIERVSVNVVTRVQNAQTQGETKARVSKQGTKRRQKHRACSKGSKKSKGEPQGSDEILE